MVSTDLLYFNGINGATGEYLVPPMTPNTLTDIIRGETWDAAHLSELRWRHQQDTTRTYALKEGLDPKKLAEAGWGVIFAAYVGKEMNAAIREALSELLDHRKAQAGPLYREYIGSKGYRRDESKNDFLARNGAGPGPVDPANVPYYLLIVGDPQTIPYRFQYELDVAYAVGRIHFRSLDEYAQYARSVVESESGKVKLPRRTVFFGVANPNDRATALSAKNLIEPLAQVVSSDQPTWDVETITGADATKSRLSSVLGGAATPAVLFTASHGMAFPNGHAQQVPFQGALLCQDWPGPQAGGGEIRRDYYFGGEDIARDANLLGTIAFHFACYGAGTPYWDDFSKLAFKKRSAIAPYAFLADLPRRLLGHPKGGALAVVGHVERAWTFSFDWEKAGTQIVSFESTLKRLLEDHPIGSALDYMNSRYAEISTMLSNELEEAEYTKPDPYKLANLWTSHNDARGYALVGDPAVRLPVAPAEQGAMTRAAAAPRPVIAIVESSGDPVPMVLAGDAGNTPPATAPANDAQVDSLPPAAGGELPAEFGIWGTDSLKQLRESLTGTLQKLSDRMAQVMDNIASLEVATYVSEDMEAVKYDRSENRFTGGVKLRAVTRINLDGDMKVIVPVDSDDSETIDMALWEIHRSMVEQAQANRAEIFKIAAEVLGNFLLPGQNK